MNRRGLLVGAAAAAPAALLTACGGQATESTTPAPVRGSSEVAKQGDQELLAFLIGLEEAAGETVPGVLRGRLKGAPIPPGTAADGEPMLMVAYLDALPKLSNADLRGLALDRLVEHARHEASERDDAIGEAFVPPQGTVA